MTTRLLLQRSLRSFPLNRNASVVLGISSLTTTTTAATTFCDDGAKDILKKKKDGSVDWDATQVAVATTIGKSVQKAVDTGIPTQLSYGFVCGYASGYALKKVGRLGAIIGGTNVFAFYGSEIHAWRNALL